MVKFAKVASGELCKTSSLGPLIRLLVVYWSVTYKYLFAQICQFQISDMSAWAKSELADV